jgi:hypothetical protein
MMVAANGHTIRRHNPTATVSKATNVIQTTRVEEPCDESWSFGRICIQFKHGRNRRPLQLGLWLSVRRFSACNESPALKSDLRLGGVC